LREDDQPEKIVQYFFPAEAWDQLGKSCEQFVSVFEILNLIKTEKI
jgi:hypothetical protein